MGFEQRVYGGLRHTVWHRVALEVGGGYAFDRYFGEGENQGSRLSDRVDVSPGPFLEAAVRFVF